MNLLCSQARQVSILLRQKSGFLEKFGEKFSRFDPLLHSGVKTGKIVQTLTNVQQKPNPPKLRNGKAETQEQKF